MNKNNRLNDSIKTLDKSDILIINGLAAEFFDSKPEGYLKEVGSEVLKERSKLIVDAVTISLSIFNDTYLFNVKSKIIIDNGNIFFSLKNLEENGMDGNICFFKKSTNGAKYMVNLESKNKKSKYNFIVY